MDVRQIRPVVLLILCVILCGCSQRVAGPEGTSWQAVPCEYRLEGDDESLLLVRAQVTDFDSAKIVLHSLSWTVWGDTLARRTALFPDRCTRSGKYATFSCASPLSMNTVIRGVELFVKNQATVARRRNL